jgi:hypothetical protein
MLVLLFRCEAASLLTQGKIPGCSREAAMKMLNW